MNKPKPTVHVDKKSEPLTQEEANMLRKALSRFEDDTPFLEYCEEMKALKAKKNQVSVDGNELIKTMKKYEDLPPITGVKTKL